MSAKHHAFKFVGVNKVYTYENEVWASLCRVEPTRIKLDSRWLDVYTYKPIKKDKKLIPRPKNTYRGARRNTRYEDLAWRRECSIH